jgi:hypothetical protein
MRYLLVLVTLLAGCQTFYDVALYPKGGGPVAQGIADTSSNKKITVSLNGETYSGIYVQGQSLGIASVVSGYSSASAYAIGTTNQYSAVLTGPAGAIRCEFTAQRHGGNGVCLDSTNKTYDMVITAK